MKNLELGKLYETCYRDNLHSIWASQELYRKGEFLSTHHILMSVYVEIQRMI